MRPIITACGNLTKTPILEKTSKGTPVVRFTVACNAGKDEEATFLWCVAYKKSAENIAKFFDKGSPIVVTGSLRQYSDEKRVQHFVCDVSEFGFVSGARANKPPAINEKRDSGGETCDEAESAVQEGEDPF